LDTNAWLMGSKTYISSSPSSFPISEDEPSASLSHLDLFSISFEYDLSDYIDCFLLSLLLIFESLFPYITFYFIESSEMFVLCDCSVFTYSISVSLISFISWILSFRHDFSFLDC